MGRVPGRLDNCPHGRNKRRKPVHIYALVRDEELAEDLTFQEWAKIHQEMILEYRAQNWSETRTLIDECLQRGESLECFYELYRQRVDFYEKDPPGNHWDGVFVVRMK